MPNDTRGGAHGDGAPPSRDEEGHLQGPAAPNPPARHVSWSDLSQEPFRYFFPLAVLVGLLGVALWPLYFSSLVQFYPGLTHARLMTYGFFGGFMLGFLGTALPRMLSAQPLRPLENAVLLGIYLAMVTALFARRTLLGDWLYLALLATFGALAIMRVVRRADVPPPGFILVGLAILCGATGAALGIYQNYREEAFLAGQLQHLLVYQGFILLPILGVGAFLLPRFFGWASHHNFPESVSPPPGWMGRALTALAAGVLIIASLWLEAKGWYRGGPALRLIVTAVYLGLEVPFYRPLKTRNAPARALRMAFYLLLGGFLAIVLWPELRVSLLHLTLVGGFAVVTLTVGTRVIFGHSGHLPRLDRPNRWFRLAVSLMLLAMLTRISGDLFPQVLASHYTYGAMIWIAGVLLWAFYVLPKVRLKEPEDLG